MGVGCILVVVFAISRIQLMGVEEWRLFRKKFKPLILLKNKGAAFLQFAFKQMDGGF
jgi:hypothetical protein